MTNLNYVKWIQENKIILFCENEKQIDVIKKLGAKKRFFSKKIWIIQYSNEEELSAKLQSLNDYGFMFAGGTYGWNPVDIFISLREKGFVHGQVTEIVWGGQGKILNRLL